MMLPKFTVFDKEIDLSAIPKPYLYTLGGVTTAGLLLKIYLKWTTGRYKVTENLDGKVVLITGATSDGIGKATAEELARHGATVHILARNMKKGENVVNELKKRTRNHNIYLHHVDLSDFTTVRMFTKKFLATDSPIHILINNAATMNGNIKLTVDGIEETFQANHLSHFLLTNQLLDRIISSGPSRIINVTSLAHTFAVNYDLKDIMFRRTKYTPMTAYAWSKLANVLFTRELASRLHGKSVTVNCVHPGAVDTEMCRNSPLRHLVYPALPFFKTPFEGAQTLLYLATAKEVENITGTYFVDCKPAATSLSALDNQLAAELWFESEEMTRIKRS